MKSMVEDFEQEIERGIADAQNEDATIALASTITLELELGSPEFWKRLADDPRAVAAQVCSIDLVNIEQTMQHHSALRAWLNAAHESARIDEMSAEFEQTRARARAMIKAQESLSAVTGKAKTVDVLKAEVELAPEVIDADKAYVAARERTGALKAMSSAGEDRLQMLIQLASRQRAEIRDANRN